jgi:hypothetical protein
MTPEQMQDLKSQLDALAAVIKQKSNEIESKRQDEIALDDAMQTIKMSAMNQIFTMRDSLTSKLLYTNDDQRKAALSAMLDANANYQNLKSSRSVKIVERVLLESELEFQRKSYRALELQTLFHANNPTA